MDIEYNSCASAMWVIYSVFVFIIIILFIWLYIKQTRGYCKCSKHLVGKTAIVTGANTGLGFETAKNFAERGARIILACRNETKGITARDQIRNLSRNNDVHYRHLDLSSFDSVRNFVKEIIETEQHLHILVNNAGCFPENNNTTKDGLLVGMQTNYFGPFLLTNLLIPLLNKSAPSRIINVSSFVHAFGYVDLNNINMERPMKFFANNFIYFNSKLCNILTTLELDRRLKGTGVTVNSLNPGAVNTNFININSLFLGIILKIFAPFFKSARTGAQTAIYLGVSPDVELVSGSYFQECSLANTSRTAKNKDLAQNLWTLSEQIVNITCAKSII